MSAWLSASPKRSPMRWRQALAGVALILPASWCAAQLKDGSDLCARGSYAPDQRIEVCTQALDTESMSAPVRAATLNNRGVAWKTKGDLDRALADYDEAIRLDPGLANAYNNRGAALGAKGEFDAAMRSFDTAIRLDPGLSRAYVNRGLARQARGDLDGALADFDQASAKDPSDARIFLNRARLWQQKGNPGKALDDLSQAIRVDPTDESLFIARGRLWDQQGNYVRSIADYDEAIRLNPNAASAYSNRCNTWLLKGMLREALADCGQAERIDPGLAPAHFNRGVALGISGDTAKAAAEFDETIRLDPDFAPAYKSRGQLEFDDGRFEAAQADLARASHALDRDPYAALWSYLAQARASRDPAAGRGDLAKTAARLVPGAWPGPVIDLMLDRADPGAVFQAAQQGDPRIQADQQCEASFYVGEWRLLRGEKPQAVRLLEDAQRNCQRSFAESAAAGAELERSK